MHVDGEHERLFMNHSWCGPCAGWRPAHCTSSGLCGWNARHPSAAGPCRRLPAHASPCVLPNSRSLGLSQHGGNNTLSACISGVVLQFASAVAAVIPCATRGSAAVGGSPATPGPLPRRPLLLLLVLLILTVAAALTGFRLLLFLLLLLLLLYRGEDMAA